MYEVRVAVSQKHSEHYSYTLRQRVSNTVLKLFHFWANDPSHALHQAKKHGRPISVRKVNRGKINSNIEHIKLDQKPYGEDSVFENAIAMDELIWNKKVKRSERIEDRKKDKAGY